MRHAQPLSHFTLNVQVVLLVLTVVVATDLKTGLALMRQTFLAVGSRLKTYFNKCVVHALCMCATRNTHATCCLGNPVTSEMAAAKHVT